MGCLREAQCGNTIRARIPWQHASCALVNMAYLFVYVSILTRLAPTEHNFFVVEPLLIHFGPQQRFKVGSLIC